MLDSIYEGLVHNTSFMRQLAPVWLFLFFLILSQSVITDSLKLLLL